MIIVQALFIYLFFIYNFKQSYGSMFIDKDLQPSLTFASLHYENIYIRLVGFYEYKMITKDTI